VEEVADVLAAAPDCGFFVGQEEREEVVHDRGVHLAPPGPVSLSDVLELQGVGDVAGGDFVAVGVVSGVF
jgi:hypothetical protein